MSFLPTPARRIVLGDGPKDAKIAIIGEAPGAQEDARLKPFVGKAGGVLDQCLHAAGIIRPDVYLTNVVKVRPPNNDIKGFFSGKTFTPEGYEWVELLREELNSVGANVLVAAGAVPFAALTGRSAITKLRGYVFESVGLTEARKVIPTIHPAASLYERKGGAKGGLASAEFKPYLFRHVIACDLKKARVESGFRELRRPDRQIITSFGTVGEVLEWLDYFASRDIVSVDIETPSYIGEMVSFALSSEPNISASFSLHEPQWDLMDEAMIFRGLQKVLGNPNSKKVFQNGVFDVWFLSSRYGFIVRGPIHDTMIAHHVQYSELPKGLGFLGSLYCGAQAYWKDMVKFDNLKEEA